MDKNVYDSNPNVSLGHCMSLDCHKSKVYCNRSQMEVWTSENSKTKGTKVSNFHSTKCEQRFIYYPITKLKLYQKNTYNHLREANKDMKVHIINNKVKVVAMPRIGCWRDKFDYIMVKGIIRKIFKETNVKIIISTI